MGQTRRQIYRQMRHDANLCLKADDLITLIFLRDI